MLFGGSAILKVIKAPVHLLPVHINMLTQSLVPPHALPLPHGAHAPPQSTSVSLPSSTPSRHRFGFAMPPAPLELELMLLEAVALELCVAPPALDVVIVPELVMLPEPVIPP